MQRGRFARPAPLTMAVLAVAAIIAGCSPAPNTPVLARSTTAGPGPRPTPVIFVTGWQLDCSFESEQTWALDFNEAARRGYTTDEMSLFTYQTCEPNAGAIARLGQRVDEVLAATGATKVNLMTHSMGSLVSRWCIRFGGCAGKVAKMFSTAPPNHGTIWAGLCPVAFWHGSCSDMVVDGPFVTELNAADETWGSTEYVTVISWCDQAIVPFTSSAIDGATNIVTDRCLGHTDWRGDQAKSSWAFDWFASPAGAPTPAASRLMSTT